MSSYEEKVIIKFLWIKRVKHGATRIVNDHRNYEWDMNGVRKLLKKINKTGGVA